MHQTKTPRPLLPRDQWLEVIARAPLISIDLIIRDQQDRVLLGYRNNEPARGSWFVPGGVIRKDEPLDEAFTRIAQAELGVPLQRGAASFLGVYEHFYSSNFAGSPDITTHYIVLAHLVRVSRLPALPADLQHQELRGFTAAELLAHPQVHDNAKAYLR
jgi:colanic acid biosynthesis protein WcaH